MFFWVCPGWDGWMCGKITIVNVWWIDILDVGFLGYKNSGLDVLS